MQQGRAQAGLRARRGLAATAAAPDLTVGPLRGLPVEILQAAADRAARYAGNERHGGNAATAGGTRLAGRKQTQSTLVEMARNAS